MANPIWYHTGTQKFYQIPATQILIPGAEELQNLQGEVKFVSLDLLASYIISTSKASQQLNQALQQQMEQTKTAFQQLLSFNQIAPQEKPLSTSNQQQLSQLLSLFQKTASPTASADILQDISNAPAGQFPKSLQELFPEEEQKDMVGQVMNRLRGIAQKLDTNIADEDDHPSAWVEVLYNNLFQDEIATKKKATAERIEASVNESIANALRANGVTPSADFE